MIAKSENQSTEFSAENINGIYQNRIGNSNTVGLWNILADNKTFKGDTTPVTINSVVKIELLSDTELKASLIENESITKYMLFSGKITGNYFSIKKKLIVIPIPALFFHRERKTILGTYKNGNLNVTRGYKNGAWFLFMAGDYGGISNYQFERIKN